jgi:hypothetical protein
MFITNVIVQVIERHIAERLSDIFNDERVRKLTQREVKDLVEDDYEVRTERRELRAQEAILAKGREICRQIGTRPDLGPVSRTPMPLVDFLKFLPLTQIFAIILTLFTSMSIPNFKHETQLKHQPAHPGVRKPSGRQHLLLLGMIIPWEHPRLPLVERPQYKILRMVIPKIVGIIQAQHNIRPRLRHLLSLQDQRNRVLLIQTIANQYGLSTIQILSRKDTLSGLIYR